MASARGDGQEHYVHKLVVAENVIRLLAILPARFDDPISCTLNHVSLDDEPAYEALSYTWGAPIMDHSLACNGKILAVTQNLFEGLRRVRRRKAVRVIWVDAICINQTDVPERNRQILLMGKIYQQASQVVVWLGVPGDGEDLVDLGDLREWILTNASKHRRVLPASWLSHINRPWFQRVWIMQEAVLARKLTFIHDHQKIPWRDFVRISEEFTDLRNNHPNTRLDLALVASLTTIRRINNSRSQESLSDNDFHTVLEFTQVTHATDVRDKIYGLRGLLPRHIQDVLIPDYALSTIEMLIKTARALINVSGDLELLRRSLPHSRRPGLPTWVPDFVGSGNAYGATWQERDKWHEWTFRKPEWNFRKQRRHKIGTVLEVMKPDEGRIGSFYGIQQARIEFISDDYIEGRTEDEHIDLLKCLFSWYAVVRTLPVYRGDSLTRLASFIDTVMCKYGWQLFGKTILYGRGHNFGTFAYCSKRYIFLSNLADRDAGSDEWKKSYRRTLRGSEVIRHVARLKTDPRAYLNNSIPFQRRRMIQHTDVYPTVPADSDAESGSLEGNISSYKNSEVSLSSLSPPSRPSIGWTIAEGPFLQRLRVKAGIIYERRVTRPARTAKSWTSLTVKQYRKHREHYTERAAAAAARGQGSTPSDSTPEHSAPPTRLASADSSNPGSNHPDSDDADDEISTPASPNHNTSPSSSTSSFFVGGEARSVPNPPYPLRHHPFYSLLPKQYTRYFIPCTCTENDGDINYTHHLTPEEDARIFDPSDPAMLTKQVRDLLQVKMQNFGGLKIEGKRFGYVRFRQQSTKGTGGTQGEKGDEGKGEKEEKEEKGEEGEDVIVLGMFPIQARRGDMVALLRGLLMPVVLREVEEVDEEGVRKRRWEWVGPCCLSRCWDWKFLEREKEEGGAGLEGLEVFEMV